MEVKPSSCPICGNPEMQTIFTLDDLPLFCNVLHNTRPQALEAERASIRLDCCAHCGFIYNAAFEPNRLQYGPDYGNDLSASPHFRKYARHIAQELVRRHHLHNKDIVEIGCGNGYFLKLICSVGKNRGVGFDPSYDPQQAAPSSEPEVEIVAERYALQQPPGRVDMICCRHVLEHVHDPLGFLRRIRKTLDARADCVLFFEVPNATHTFDRGAVWDILYEHCNYFTAHSLYALFAAAGFQPLRVDERYDGQFLTIEARPVARAAAPELVQAQGRPADFPGVFHGLVNSWRAQMAAWDQEHRQVVAWGAGTKGATFLNVLGLFHNQLEYVVDINPGKQGRFVPGTGQEIIAPAALAWCRPDTIIVMNPAYAGEIRHLAGRYVAGVALVAATRPVALRR